MRPSEDEQIINVQIYSSLSSQMAADANDDEDENKQTTNTAWKVPKTEARLSGLRIFIHLLILMSLNSLTF